MPKQPVPWKRLAAEFVVIGVGVFLGLLADDYRDRRLSREAEQEYLRLLVRDLDRDVDALDVPRAGVEAQARVIEEIFLAVRQGQSDEEFIEEDLSSLFFTWTYENQRPTYLSLRDGGQLSLISDPAVRSAVTDYFEISQSRLQAYVMDYRLAHQRMRADIGEYVQILSPQTSERIWPPASRWAQLVSPLDDLAEDYEFWNDLMEVGARSFELLDEIDRVISENRQLLGLVEEGVPAD